jgi:hypothetical protein
MKRIRNSQKCNVVRTGILLAILVYVFGWSTTLAQGNKRAGLVVQYADGTTTTHCVTFAEPSISGYDVLRRSGLPISIEASSFGAAICKIGDTGCNFPAQSCFCQCENIAASCAFWGYFHRIADGSWQFSQSGASNFQVNDGMVEGWAWGKGSGNSSEAVLPNITIDQICNAVPAAATHTPQPTVIVTNTPLPPSATPLPTQQTPTPVPAWLLSMVTVTPEPTNTQPEQPPPTNTPQLQPQPTATQIVLATVNALAAIVPTSPPAAQMQPTMTTPATPATPATATASRIISIVTTPVPTPRERSTNTPEASATSSARAVASPEAVGMLPAVVMVRTSAPHPTPTPFPSLASKPVTTVSPNSATANVNYLIFGAMAIGLVTLFVIIRIKRR